MEVGDGRSSSNDLSSAPPSDAESTPGPLSHLTGSHRDVTAAGNFGVANTLTARHSLPSANSAASPATTAGTRQDGGAAPPIKKPRKKRDPNAPPEPEKEKKVRATRRPRGAASTATATSRKKLKTEQPDEESTIHIQPLSSSGLQSSTLVQPVSFSQGPLEIRRDEGAKFLDSGVSMHDAAMRNQASAHRPYEYNSNAPAPAPKASTRSTPMYDPIRSLTNPAPTVTVQPTQTPPRVTYNPSTSPAISGIIDHPPQANTATATAAVTHLSKADNSYNHANGRVIDSPKVNGASSTGESLAVEQPQPKKGASKKVPSEAPTRTTSPKPARAKEQPPPPPVGSGLLSASLFGGDSSMDATQKDSGKGPNIVLHIDIRDPNNRVINFARLAEEKYGFAALYPRQAAQKERLAKIAAAGAALERSASGSKFGGTSAGDSGDEDLSVDIERDSDNDGDVAMSGLNGGAEPANSGTDGPGPKRKRKRKVEEYDQDDPFVDDSELLWEAQAAASKDGFFVYCGPLVPEGEKPAVERYVPLLSIDTLDVSGKANQFSSERMAPSNVVVAVVVEVVPDPEVDVEAQALLNVALDAVAALDLEVEE